MSLNTPGGRGKEGSRQRAPTDCVQGFSGVFLKVIGCYRVIIRKPWPQSIGAPDGALSPPAADQARCAAHTHIIG